VVEGTETFTVSLDATNALVTDSDTATGTLTDNDSAAPPALPDTGFPMGRVTSLPIQPSGEAYKGYSSLTLDISGLGVTVPIVGVPQSGSSWDVRWLGSQVGYLFGTAFPTWEGNTVLTAHNYDASGLPGPFAELESLKWGDEVIIHAWGREYTYEVRQNYLAHPTSTNPLKHEEYDWVTLITCQGFDETLGDYLYRRVVRAVLIAVD